MNMQKSSQDTPVNQNTSVKIHAFLAHSGVASRRRAEELVSQGRVTINGVKAVIGQRIDPEKDAVAVNGKPIQRAVKSVYFLLHKPAGYVSTTNDELGRPTVLSLLPKALLQKVGRLYPVGRLDIESEGLLLLTNDGALAQKLTHPRFEVTKTYQVQLDRQPSGKALSHLHRGVKLKDGLAMVDSIDPLHENHPADQVWFSLTVHEGRNRLIRRLWERLGYDVKRLIRVSFGQFSLEQLGGKRWIQVDAPNV
jgi:23S rRNA pseudouridine2605 synthase